MGSGGRTRRAQRLMMQVVTAELATRGRQCENMRESVIVIEKNPAHYGPRSDRERCFAYAFFFF